MSLRHVKYFAALIAAACLFFSITVMAKSDNMSATTHATTVAPQPVKKEKGLVFSVFGDWGRNGKQNQTEVANVMVKKGVGKFIISVGDNFQVAGVRSVNDPLWNISYESVYSDPALYCDWYPALGNHDYKGNVQAEIDYSKISRRWNMEGRYYSLHQKLNDSTSADFYIIDTSPFQTAYYSNNEHAVAGQDTARQMRWIDSCLTNSKATWKLVFGHHPVYSSGGAHGKETGDMQARFASFFEKKGVDAYFCGHDHDFEYLKTKDGNVNYFVCGTGSEVREMGTILPISVFSKSVPGFTKVLFTPEKMKVTMIDTSGAEIYNTEIVKKVKTVVSSK